MATNPEDIFPLPLELEAIPSWLKFRFPKELFPASWLRMTSGEQRRAVMATVNRKVDLAYRTGYSDGQKSKPPEIPSLDSPPSLDPSKESANDPSKEPTPPPPRIPYKVERQVAEATKVLKNLHSSPAAPKEQFSKEQIEYLAAEKLAWRENYKRDKAALREKCRVELLGVRRQSRLVRQQERAQEAAFKARARKEERLAKTVAKRAMLVEQRALKAQERAAKKAEKGKSLHARAAKKAEKERLLQEARNIKAAAASERVRIRARSMAERAKARLLKMEEIKDARAKLRLAEMSASREAARIRREAQKEISWLEVEAARKAAVARVEKRKAEIKQQAELRKEIATLKLRITAARKAKYELTLKSLDELNEEIEEKVQGYTDNVAMLRAMKERKQGEIAAYKIRVQEERARKTAAVLAARLKKAEEERKKAETRKSRAEAAALNATRLDMEAKDRLEIAERDVKRLFQVSDSASVRKFAAQRAKEISLANKPEERRDADKSTRKDVPEPDTRVSPSGDL